MTEFAFINVIDQWTLPSTAFTVGSAFPFTQAAIGIQLQGACFLRIGMSSSTPKGYFTLQDINARELVIADTSEMGVMASAAQGILKPSIAVPNSYQPIFHCTTLGTASINLQLCQLNN